MTHSDGVITMEIVNCQPEDSGKYRCVATNHLGSDETYCVVIVEGELAWDDDRVGCKGKFIDGIFSTLVKNVLNHIALDVSTRLSAAS